MEIFKKIYKSFAEVAFPPICICCGSSTNSEHNMICSLCRTKRFESAATSDIEILPQSVLFVHTMWFFDKGGYLQDLLHELKYHFMRKVGNELGILAGNDFREKISNKSILNTENAGTPMLVPVPLHPGKRKSRGYNQARALAEGVQRSTGWDLIEKEAVKRTKKTRTQTGLNIDQRSENLRGAFQVKKPELVKNRQCIIVDDVFTTGATTFELAKEIYKLNKKPSGILTVARA